MRELDKKTIESGTSGDILMERAGYGAVNHILDFISSLSPDHAKRFVILAGKGNNGGDAYVVAKGLAERTKLKIKIFAVCPISELKGSALFHARKIPGELSCEVRKNLSLADFQPGDIIIDGLLGTGFSKPVKDPYKQWIETVNRSNLPVIALDIPSGFDADSGDGSESIIADLSITMGLPKNGFLKDSAPNFCGTIKCIDIGIPSAFIEEIQQGAELFMISDARQMLKRIPRNSHKKRRGYLSVFGGSKKYAGAPFLSAIAALRSGCGYVICATPSCSFASKCASNIPLSLICREIANSSDGYFDTSSFDSAKEILLESNAVVIGPGLSTSKSCADFLSEILKLRPCPLLLDADALNLLSANPAIFAHIPPKTVLTPHPGEMRRLLTSASLPDLISSDKISQAVALAKKLNVVVVLKGAGTVVTDGEQVSVNSSGTPALATAGTGDVLSGIIGTFLAQGYLPFDSARLGVFIHGLAAELSPFGQAGLIADDLFELIPTAMKKISPFA